MKIISFLRCVLHIHNWETIDILYHFRSSSNFIGRKCTKCCKTEYISCKDDRIKIKKPINII